MWRAALVAGACTLTACGAPQNTQVREVIDGDTIEVTVRGRVETVRLLGIDTPETVHPDKPAECFGPESSALLNALLPTGTQVTLTRDTEPRDHFGRLLAYVRRDADGLEVNEHLVAVGAARTLSIAPNNALRARLATLEHAAQRAKIGLWGAC